MIAVLTQRALKASAILALKIRKKSRVGIAEPTIPYFAYGANLSPDRFKRYEMNGLPIGVGSVADYELRFSLPCEYLQKGFASIHPVPGQTVWGYLYKLDRLTVFLLDTMEWAVLNQYRKIAVSVTLRDTNEVVQAFAYQARYPREGLCPSLQYKQMILSSASERNLPTEYISALEQIPAKDSFPLDPEFSFLFPPRKRLLAKQLRSLYLRHDRIREKVCALLRF